MKKTLLFITVTLVVLTVSTAKSQIISAADDDFETWAADPANGAAMDPNTGSVGAPAWECLNPLSSVILGNSPISVFEENSIVHSGNHSCKITSVVLTATSYNYVKSFIPRDTTGLLMTATFTSQPSIVPGAPYNKHIHRVDFWYQYMPQMNNGKPDTAFGLVVMTKAHVVIGQGYVKLNAAATWTQDSIVIAWTSGNAPDTIQVYYSSSSLYKPAPGSILYVDGVSPLAVNDIADAAKASVEVYPNPAFSQVNFRVKGENAHSIEVYDITGKEVSAETLKDNALSLNTNTYPAGLYIYKLVDKNSAVIKVGKFTVEK